MAGQAGGRQCEWELTRYRQKLVGLRTSCKDQVHGVLAKLGVPVACTDIFGTAGSAWLDQLGLPQPYAAPQGVLLVARERHARILGTVGVKRLAEGIADIKRLYVAPAGRGRGLGQALLESAIASAARLHYSRVRLDSHRPSMTAAIALYRKLGFAEIEPYGAKPSPDADMCFFERALP